ncbi:MAG TPA: tyrosine-type recombinase/integrase [Candidatus Dormibacteraeota bacterium]|nr:tyrosine-type recombinase/integrase [Candidatus Dormibacteraeota bacterium]
MPACWAARLVCGDQHKRATQGSQCGNAEGGRGKASRRSSCGEGGTLPIGKSPTVEAYLERWLQEVIKPRRAAWTWRGYRAAVRSHVVPTIGRVRLDRLTGLHVDLLMNRMAAGGAGPKTVANVRTLLRSALNQAVRWHLIGRNPVVDTEPPKRVRHEIEPLTKGECRRLLEAVSGDRLEALYTVAVALGLRQGEALGLTWADVELSIATLHVRRQLQRVEGRLQLVPLKTERSTRTLAMPAVVVAALTRHRERQLAEGRALLPSAYVFTTAAGGPLEARTVLRWFADILDRAKLRHVRFHDLRHSAASLMLIQGVPMRVIMEMLGHSQLSTTSDTYSHVVPELQREAAARIDAVLS